MSEIDIEKIALNLRSMNIKLDEVYNLLIGHEHDKDSGFLVRVKIMERNVDELCDFKKKVIYVAIGMAVPTGMGILQIITFLTGLNK